MTTPPLAATLNGKPISTLRVWVTNVGPWQADVTMSASDAPTAGRVEIKLGTLTLAGTIAPDFAGTILDKAQLKVIAGGGGWRRVIPGKSYHNDAGVKAQLIAEDAAREAGEAIGSFVPVAERVGRAYVRERGAASRALEHVAGPGVPWWVDYGGITHAKPRPAVKAAGDSFHVTAYDPATRCVTLATDDPGALGIGTILTDHLDAPGTLREMVIVATAEELRIEAWLGGTAASAGRLAGIMREIAQRSNDGQLFGSYKYRVIRMAGDGRVELQAVRKIVGLPDLGLTSVMPGLAGVHAELQPGTEVLVTFIDGDRGQPIVTHFAGVDGSGFVPVAIVIGGDPGAPAARQGDAVEVLLPPALFSGTIGPSPASGVLTFPLNKATGIITAGSGKVRIA